MAKRTRNAEPPLRNEIQAELPADYAMPDSEKNNVVYLTMKYTVGWQMRAADLAVVLLTAGEAGTGVDGVRKLVRAACEYTWDHVCGEPRETSPDDLYDHIAPILTNWYSKTTPEQRAKTG